MPQEVGTSKLHDFNFVNTPDNFVGGQIQDSIEFWKKLSRDPWILDTVTGVKIPLTQAPMQRSVPKPYRLNHDEMYLADFEVDKMVKKGIIETTVREQGDWVSNIFTRPKPDGSENYTGSHRA